MTVDSAPKANGVKTALDTIIAPKEAFESIRNTPTWSFALIISIAISMICSYLVIPAAQHAIVADWPNQLAKSPQLASMTAAQQQAALAMGQKISSFFFLFFILLVPIGNLVSAAVMSLFNSLGRGEGSFAKYWAASCNIGVVAWGVYSIVLAIVVLARGADSFNTSMSVQQAIPSLAMLVPGASAKLTAILYPFNPITLWGVVLVSLAMETIGRVPRLQAWLAGITMFLLPIAIAVPFAK